MAIAVERREPLSLLHKENLQDLGPLLPVHSKLRLKPSQTKCVRKSASMVAPRSVSATDEQPLRPAVTMGVPEPLPEDVALDLKGTGVRSRDGDRSSAPASNDVASQTDLGAAACHEQESLSLMQLKMEAMTWAAMAKDLTISDLESRLRIALEIAKAEQDRNRQLERLLRDSKQSQESIAEELRHAKEQISELAEAEERLVVQLGDFEVEAVEEDQRHRNEVAALKQKFESQDSLNGRPSKQTSLIESEVREIFKVDGSDQLSTADQLIEAKKEIDALRADFADASANVQQSEVHKRYLSRRLKTVEKERRQLLRKGAIRQARTPRSQYRNVTDAPGGTGWKVFSVLEYES